MAFPEAAKENDLARAERAMATLYASSGRETFCVTYAFLGLCLLITVPTLAYPGLYGVFGGIERRQHWWQLFTAVLSWIQRRV